MHDFMALFLTRSFAVGGPMFEPIWFHLFLRPWDGQTVPPCGKKMAAHVAHQHLKHLDLLYIFVLSCIMKKSFVMFCRFWQTLAYKYIPILNFSDQTSIAKKAKQSHFLSCHRLRQTTACFPIFWAPTYKPFLPPSVPPLSTLFPFPTLGILCSLLAWVPEATLQRFATICLAYGRIFSNPGTTDKNLCKNLGSTSQRHSRFNVKHGQYQSPCTYLI